MPQMHTNTTASSAIMTTWGADPMCDEFHPYTFPYTGSGGVNVEGNFVPSGGMIGDTINMDGSSRPVVQATHPGGQGPQNRRYYESDKKRPTSYHAGAGPVYRGGKNGIIDPNTANAHHLYWANDQAGGVASTHLSHNGNPGAPTCQFTASTETPFRQAPPAYFRTASQFPESFVGMPTDPRTVPGGGSVVINPAGQMAGEVHTSQTAGVPSINAKSCANMSRGSCYTHGGPFNGPAGQFRDYQQNVYYLARPPSPVFNDESAPRGPYPDDFQIFYSQGERAVPSAYHDSVGGNDTGEGEGTTADQTSYYQPAERDGHLEPTFGHRLDKSVHELALVDSVSLMAAEKLFVPCVTDQAPHSAHSMPRHWQTTGGSQLDHTNGWRSDRLGLASHDAGLDLSAQRERTKPRIPGTISGPCKEQGSIRPHSLTDALLPGHGNQPQDHNENRSAAGPGASGGSHVAKGMLSLQQGLEKFGKESTRPDTNAMAPMPGKFGPAADGASARAGLCAYSTTIRTALRPSAIKSSPSDAFGGRRNERARTAEATRVENFEDTMEGPGERGSPSPCRKKEERKARVAEVRKRVEARLRGALRHSPKDRHMTVHDEDLGLVRGQARSGSPKHHLSQPFSRSPSPWPVESSPAKAEWGWCPTLAKLSSYTDINGDHASPQGENRRKTHRSTSGFPKSPAVSLASPASPGAKLRRTHAFKSESDVRPLTTHRQESSRNEAGEDDEALDWVEVSSEDSWVAVPLSEGGL